MRAPAPLSSVPRTTSPGVRGTGNQPRFITAAEWQAKYGKAAS